MAAVNYLSVLYHSAVYIFIPFGIIACFENRIPLKPVLGVVCSLATALLHTKSYLSQFVLKSIRSHVGQLVLIFRSTRTHQYFFGQLVLIRSTRTHFGQFLLSLVNSFSH